MAHAEDDKKSPARYRSLLEYDGTAYYGFQRQRAEQVTIQGELERALGELAGQTVKVTGAGRTDSGVHATGQVISFEIDWQHGRQALQRALNSRLPDDISVYNLERADAGFHPRYDARRRTYEYFVFNDDVRSPTRRLRSWHVSARLDLVRMNRAAFYLEGRHDFATFGTPPQGDNTERRVSRARWIMRNEYLVFRVTADAFLYRMVRSLVGSLVAVGRGAWTPEAFKSALQAADRNQSAAAAPAQGLFLVAVGYDA